MRVLCEWRNQHIRFRILGVEKPTPYPVLQAKVSYYAIEGEWLTVDDDQFWVELLGRITFLDKALRTKVGEATMVELEKIYQEES